MREAAALLLRGTSISRNYRDTGAAPARIRGPKRRVAVIFRREGRKSVPISPGNTIPFFQHLSAFHAGTSTRILFCRCCCCIVIIYYDYYCYHIFGRRPRRLHCRGSCLPPTCLSKRAGARAPAPCATPRPPHSIWNELYASSPF